MSICLLVHVGTGVRNTYLSCLGDLDGFIESQCYDNVIVAGDFNVDFSRSGSSTRLLQSFMNDRHLSAADLAFEDSVKFTYERDDGLARSWVDHVVCNNSLIPLLSNIDSVSTGTNLSDHHLLNFNVNITISTCSVSSCSSGVSFSGFDWDKATASQFEGCRDNVAARLPSLSSDVVVCCDADCDSHIKDIDLCCYKLLDCLFDSASVNVPCRAVRRRPNLAGWNDVAGHLKSGSNFWHRIWCEA